jgi:hypothetical protein
VAAPSIGGESPLLRLGLAVVFLLLMGVAGYGWVRAFLPRLDGSMALALAAAVGAAMLALGGVLANAAGLRLEGVGAWVAPFAALGGLAAWWARSAYSGRTIFSGRTASSYSASVR